MVKSKKDKGENYVTPADLRKELLIYRESGVVTEEFGKMILKIANRYVRVPRFKDYPCINEMISDAVFRVIQQIDKLDPNQNCFAYITTICYHCFMNRINKERRVLEIRDKYQNKIYSEFENIEKIAYQTPDEEDDHESMYDYFLNSEKYYSNSEDINTNDYDIEDD